MKGITRVEPPDLLSHYYTMAAAGASDTTLMNIRSYMSYVEASRRTLNHLNSTDSSLSSSDDEVYKRNAEEGWGESIESFYKRFWYDYNSPTVVKKKSNNTLVGFIKKISLCCSGNKKING